MAAAALAAAALAAAALAAAAVATTIAAIIFVVATATATATATAASSGENHVGRDNFGSIALVAVTVLIARRADTPLDEHTGALREELAQRLAALAPEGHVMPLGSLLAHSITVQKTLRGGEPHL